MATIEISKLKARDEVPSDNAFLLEDTGSELQKVPISAINDLYSDSVSILDEVETYTYTAKGKIVAGYPVALADDLSVYQSATAEYATAYFPGVASASLANGGSLSVVARGVASVPLHSRLDETKGFGSGLWLLCGLSTPKPYYIPRGHYAVDNPYDTNAFVNRDFRRCVGYPFYPASTSTDTIVVYFNFSMQYTGGSVLESLSQVGRPSNREFSATTTARTTFTL